MSNLSEERLVGIDNSDDGNHSVDHDQGAVAVERYEASAESDSKDVNDLTKDSSSDDSKTAPTGSAAAAAAGTAGQPKTTGSKKQSGVPETDMPAHWLAVKDALDKNHNKQIVNGLWTAAIAVDKANLAKHQAELEAARANRQTADSAVRTYQDRSSSQHERIQSLETANKELNEEVDRLKARAEAAESAAAAASSVLSAIHDMAGEAADQMQTGDGWEAARPRKRASPSKPSNSGSYAAAAAAGGARTTGSPHPDFITRSNAKGDSFSRHKNVIKYCHANSLCICCYSKYTDATKAQHREHCTAAPKPDKVFPVGYKYNKSG